MPQDVSKTCLHPSFLTGRNQIKRGTHPGRARGAGLAEVEHSPAGNAEKETIWSVEVLWINMKIPTIFVFFFTEERASKIKCTFFFCPLVLALCYFLLKPLKNNSKNK